jgi:hypothetical protein
VQLHREPAVVAPDHGHLAGVTTGRAEPVGTAPLATGRLLARPQPIASGAPLQTPCSQHRSRERASTTRPSRMDIVIHVMVRFPAGCYPLHAAASKPGGRDRHAANAAKTRPGPDVPSSIRVCPMTYRDDVRDWWSSSTRRRSCDQIGCGTSPRHRGVFVPRGSWVDGDDSGRQGVSRSAVAVARLTPRQTRDDDLVAQATTLRGCAVTACSSSLARRRARARYQS